MAHLPADHLQVLKAMVAGTSAKSWTLVANARSSLQKIVWIRCMPKQRRLFSLHRVGYARICFGPKKGFMVLQANEMLGRQWLPSKTAQLLEKHEFRCTVRKKRVATHRKIVLCCQRSQNAASLSDSSQTQSHDQNKVGPTTKKKKVAMWIGYVGTEYKGLQIQRGQCAGLTIESELERAIFEAGGILESNFGHLQKSSWTRSSRTDKGVHSLCTVISMKMELPLDAWQNDLGGIAIADRINLHLPPSIRVFGVEPVSKSFSARTACSSRSYDYFLPSSFVGVQRDSTAEDIKQRVEEFRAQLKLFEGRHPFHNYTIRREYRNNEPKEVFWFTRNTDVAPAGHALSTLSDEDECNDSGPEDQLPPETESSHETKRKLAYWLHEPDTVDVIRAPHYRTISQCSCGEVERLEDASVVRVTITGASFVVHQIRKMVGTAVAVGQKLLPADVIPMSLCRHSRMVLPIAPSEGLVLSANKFIPTYKGGPCIHLSDAAAQRSSLFWLQRMAPRMCSMMDEGRDPWKRWSETLESRCHIPEEEIAVVRDAWLKWQQRSADNAS